MPLTPQELAAQQAVRDAEKKKLEKLKQEQEERRQQDLKNAQKLRDAHLKP